MKLPNRSIIFGDQERDRDSRGTIVSIVDAPISNVSIISCEPGSIRSNHYHHEDYHFMYVIEGKMDYFFRDKTTGTFEYLCVNENQTIFTPCLEWHATHFPVFSRLIVSSKNPRDQQTYENDTVREILLTPETLEQFKCK